MVEYSPLHVCSRHNNDPLQTHSCSLSDADILHSTRVENCYYNSFQNSPCSLYDDIMMLEAPEITDCSKMVKLHICKMMTIILFLNTVTDTVLQFRNIKKRQVWFYSNYIIIRIIIPFCEILLLVS
jgi:hypothetical protein